MTAVVVALAVVAVLAIVGVTVVRRARGAAMRTGVDRIDPFTVGEPWRRHVAAAQGSLRRYREMVGTTRAGPLRERMRSITAQVEHGVDECWQIARRGHQLDDVLERLRVPSLRTQLERATAAGDTAGAASLQSQVDSAERIRATRDGADAQLRLATTRLGELLAQAAEVSAGSSAGDGGEQLGAAVDDVVTQLEALRQAVQDVNAIGGGRDPGQATATP